jgi:predicted nucleotidyltransferase component of viral defense system
MKQHNPTLITKIRRYATSNNISLESALIKFVGESFWNRIYEIDTEREFIAKGGFILGNIFGIKNRTSKDLDGSFIGKHSIEQVENFFDKVSKTEIDEIKIKVIKVDKTPITANKPLPGFGVSFLAIFPPEDGERPNKVIKINFHLDATDNEDIIPEPKSLNFSTINGDEITVNSYPLEQIIAEKLEAVLSHGTRNTRMKDFSDLYVFKNDYIGEIDVNELIKSLNLQFKLRNTELDKTYILNLLVILLNQENTNKNWIKYMNEQNLDYSLQDALDATRFWFHATELI